jgi:hypothetical protein
MGPRAVKEKRDKKITLFETPDFRRLAAQAHTHKVPPSTLTEQEAAMTHGDRIHYLS